MPTLLHHQEIRGGVLELGRASTVLGCSLSGVVVAALEGETQIVESTLHGCDLRKVPARAFRDCRLVSCTLPRGVDERANRVEHGPATRH